MTISNPEAVAKILRSKGTLEGKAITSLFSYKTPQNKKAFAIFLTEENDIYQNPYVKNPILLFQKPSITPEGKDFLKNLEKKKRNPTPQNPQEEIELPS